MERKEVWIIIFQGCGNQTDFYPTPLRMAEIFIDFYHPGIKKSYIFLTDEHLVNTSSNRLCLHYLQDEKSIYQ